MRNGVLVVERISPRVGQVRFILHPSSFILAFSRRDHGKQIRLGQRCAMRIRCLTDFGVAHECRVMSAHRTPTLAGEFASSAGIAWPRSELLPQPAARRIWQV